MKTEIICTIGPATNKPEIIEKMAHAGMTYARVNCSHGGMTSESNKEIVEMLKRVRAEKNLNFKLMLDTKGPDARTKSLEGGFTDLDKGQEFTLTINECLGNNTRVFVNVATLPSVVKPNQKILLGDGMIKVIVKKTTPTDVICEVLAGGRLFDNKTLFAPDCDLGMPFLADYDKQDLLLGKQMGMDVVAASFVNSELDLIEMQTFMHEFNCELPIIAKIESSGGIRDIDKIIAGCDGIMVARGDLGIEYPLEKIPALQEMMIKKCNAAGKMVIVATEMMESMRRNPRPTRAEVTDVYTAIRQGADAVMTSSETAIGKYPVKTVLFMARISVEAKK